MRNFEKIGMLILIGLILFTFGIQIGIKHGRDLEKQEIMEVYGN